MNIIGIITGRVLLNYIGGTIRYIYGSIWRTIFDKPKFTFRENIYGIKTKDVSETTIHEFNNRIIGFIFLGLLSFILIEYLVN